MNWKNYAANAIRRRSQLLRATLLRGRDFYLRTDNVFWWERAEMEIASWQNVPPMSFREVELETRVGANLDERTARWAAAAERIAALNHQPVVIDVNDDNDN